MSALVFMVAFALILGAVQLFGIRRDTRDPNGWHSTGTISPESSTVEPAVERTPVGVA